MTTSQNPKWNKRIKKWMWYLQTTTSILAKYPFQVKWPLHQKDAVTMLHIHWHNIYISPTGFLPKFLLLPKSSNELLNLPAFAQNLDFYPVRLIINRTQQFCPVNYWPDSTSTRLRFYSFVRLLINRTLVCFFFCFF